MNTRKILAVLAVLTMFASCGMAANPVFYRVNGVVTKVEENTVEVSAVSAAMPIPVSFPSSAETVCTTDSNGNTVCLPAAFAWASPSGNMILSTSAACTTCPQGVSMMQSSPGVVTMAAVPYSGVSGGCTSAGHPVIFGRARSAFADFRANRPVLFPRLHAMLNR